MEKYIETWALLENGKLSHPDEMGISMIYGFGLDEIESMKSNIFEEMECAEFVAPDDATSIRFRIGNFAHQAGQMSFPETGQWDFPPHWEMECVVIGIDYPPEDK